MKRSLINRKIDEMCELMEKHNFLLPPWAYWSVEKWQEVGDEAKEIWETQMGWDVTDFGDDNFDQFGLSLFTIRNGKGSADTYPKSYCEKIMALFPGQTCPLHFHWKKNEDIILRCKGVAEFILYHSTKEEDLDKSTPIDVSVDGIIRRVQPGESLLLQAGESLFLPQYLYHMFRNPSQQEAILLGEVSTANDDISDNRLYSSTRFPTIEEDEAARYVLCNEYPRFQKK